jgi:hypothetical protein
VSAFFCVVLSCVGNGLATLQVIGTDQRMIKVKGKVIPVLKLSTTP